eukprot:COSAG02_NODE_60443_length_271_cov_0.767442_1_plen_76_part_01
MEVAESTDTATLLSDEHTSSTSSWREAGLAKLSFAGNDDGRDHLRKLCYIRSNILVENINVRENYFTARGNLSLFW